jgi:hypothetical protein
MPVKKHHQRLTVDFLISDKGTFKCLILAGLGFSNKYITKCTNLTTSEISQRVKKAGIKRKFYRDGESEIAKKVEFQAGKFVSQTIRTQLNG